MAEQSAIPIFYEADDENGEREYLRELRTWLSSQSQDAWFMFVKNMNWDSMDSLSRFMIEDPQCDIAIVARIFWGNDPGWHVANSDKRSEGGADNDRIITNFGRGFYRRSEFALNRFELLDNVQTYVQAVREQRALSKPLPFTLPRALLGPFIGREPEMARGNDATERHLDDIIEGLGSSYLYRTNAEWRDAYESNYALRHYLTLPPLSPSSQRDLHRLDELAHIEALYGSVEQYMTARRKIADRPFAGRANPPSILGRLRWATKNWRGDGQFYDGV